MPLNRFGVTSARGVITAALLTQRNTRLLELTSRDALELAAWLVVTAETNATFYGNADPEEKAIADQPINELERVFERIRSGEAEPPPIPPIGQPPTSWEHYPDLPLEVVVETIDPSTDEVTHRELARRHSLMSEAEHSLQAYRRSIVNRHTHRVVLDRPFDK